MADVQPQEAAAPAPPQLIAVKDPQGQIGTVPADQVHDALASGYEPVGAEEYQKHLWTTQHETTGQQVATAAEGVLQGAIPGAATAEAGLGISPIAEQNARRQVNPTLATGGRLVGGGLQMAGVAALTGGLGDLAEGAEGLGAAADAATDVSRGTEAADAAAAAGGSPGAVSAAADTAAAQGPTSLADALLKNKAMGYAEQAAAGGIQSGTGYVNESELGDHDFNGQALAQEIGLGALLGVGGEAGINVLGEKVLPPVLRKAGDVLDAAGDKFKSTFTTLSDKLNQLEPGTTGKAWEALFSGAKRPGAKVAEDIADSVDQIGDKLADIGKAHEDSFRPDEAARNLEDVPIAQAAPHVEVFSATIDHARSQLEQLAEKNGYAGGLLKKLNGVSEDFEAARAKAVNAEDLHKAILHAKQQLGDIAFGKNAGVKTGEEALADDAVKRAWGQASDTLKNPEAFGASQAARNSALDAATRQKINAAKQVAKDFGLHEIDLDSGRNELSMKPSRILAALKSDPIASQEKLTHLNEYVDAAKKYLEEVKTSAGTAGAVVPGGDDLHDLLDHLTAQRAAGQAYAPVTDLLRQSRQQAPWGLGAGGAAPLAGFAAHALGAGAGVVAPVVGAVAAIRSPVKAIQAFAKIASTAATAKQVIGSAVRKTFANAPARAAITGLAETPLRGRTIQNENGAASGKDFQRQSKHISELASNPQDQMNRLAQNTTRISSVAPSTTQAMHQSAIAGLNVLAAALPKNPAPSLLASENKDWEPSQAQIEKWDELHSAILKPSSYLAKLANGTADPDVWNALQQAYPAWTEEVKSQTMEHIQTHPKLELDDGQKLAASMILGVPISPSVDPAQVSFQQGLFASTPSPGRDKSPRAGKPPQSGLAHLDVAQSASLNPQEKA